MARNDYFGNDPDTTDELKLSKINSAGLINLRMSKLWDNANNNAVKGNYDKWNAYLDRIWLELSGDADDKDISKFFELTFAFPKSIPEKAKGFQVVTQEKKLNLTQQYLALMKKEMFLRKLMNKQGKGTAYIEESDDWD